AIKVTECHNTCHVTGLAEVGGGSTVTVAQSLSPGNGLMKLDDKHNARYLRSVSVQVKGQQLQQHSHCAR
ncbi:hypothetical protein J6590_104819, partial [Homalodisca vitripennis]